MEEREELATGSEAQATTVAEAPREAGVVQTGTEAATPQQTAGGTAEGTLPPRDRSAVYALVVGIAAILAVFLSLLAALVLGMVAIAWGILRVRRGRPVVASFAIALGVLAIVLVGVSGRIYWSIMQYGRDPFTNKILSDSELRSFGLSDEDIARIHGAR